MNSIRLWVTVLALVSFLAGSAAGKILTERSTARDADRGALADYEELLVRQFDLSPERRRFLRVLLDHYDQEVYAHPQRPPLQLPLGDRARSPPAGN